uniref:BHLH domain-containing protein n=1 Tax=Steinernema glaseri TaxID=37863 RepID=A0A1I7YIJ4_9BILA
MLSKGKGRLGRRPMNGDQDDVLCKPVGTVLRLVSTASKRKAIELKERAHNLRKVSGFLSRTVQDLRIVYLSTVC